MRGSRAKRLRRGFIEMVGKKETNPGELKRLPSGQLLHLRNHLWRRFKKEAT